MAGVADDSTDIGSPITSPPGIITEDGNNRVAPDPGGSGGQTGTGTVTGGGIVTIQPVTVVPPVADFYYTVLTGRVVVFTDNCLNKPTQYLWDFGDGTTGVSASPVHQFPAAGTYRVVLIVMNQGGTDALEYNVSVSDLLPTANFSYAPIAKTVYFRNTSTVSGSRLWSFGDGTTSTANDPEHPYAAYGTYTVTLTVNGYVHSEQVELVASTESTFYTGANGANDPLDGYIANFDSTGTGLPFATLRSTTSAFTYPYILEPENYIGIAEGGINNNPNWGEMHRAYLLFDTSNLDDGAVITSAKIRLYVTWQKTAGFTAGNSALAVVGSTPASDTTLVVADWSQVGAVRLSTDTQMPNDSGSGLIEINLNAAGIAAISKTGKTKFGLRLACDVDNVAPTWGLFAYASWSFSDRQATTADKYPALIITIEPEQKVVASFTASVASGNAPLAVNFTDTSTNSPTSWLWEFEAGVTSTSQNPSHTFLNPGVYTVRLTAANALGEYPYAMTITVTSPDAGELPSVPPLAAFTVDVALGVAPLTVNFTDASTGTPTEWEWSWGDGTANGTTQNPIHVYASDGQYIVTLTATDAHGWTSSASKVIVVSSDTDPSDNVPIADIVSSVTSGFAPLSINFSAVVSTDAIYAWDFGDGSTSSLTAPTHLFAAPGTYTVTLTVSNLYGSTSSNITIVVAGSFAIASSSAYYYIIDKANHRILAYTKAGSYYGYFGGYGLAALGKFYNPTQLVVNRPIIGG